MSASPSQLVVGLGNPGPKYEDTRHNAGFRVVDALTDRLGVSLRQANQALVGTGTHRETALGLAKPLTYMNRSGHAVVQLRDHFGLALDQLLIVVDDLDLPVGTIRLRPGGSSGGHNGLGHIEQRLGTSEYPRLRIGIGDDFPDGQQVDYVLSPFTADQAPDIQRAVDRACDATLAAAHDGLDTAMNQFN